jgi:hypothetical protein
MTKNDRIYLNWVKSKIGILATLGNALALYDRTPPHAPIGQNLTIEDASRDTLIKMIQVRSESTSIVDIMTN